MKLAENNKVDVTGTNRMVKLHGQWDALDGSFVQSSSKAPWETNKIDRNSIPC